MKAARAWRIAFLIISLLGYAAASAAVVWGVSRHREDKKDEIPPKKALQQTADKIMQGDYGESYWKDIKTVEEVWAGKGLLATPPYYYEELKRNRDECDEVRYLDHPAYLKPYADLTRREKLLLARRIPVIELWRNNLSYPSKQMDFGLLEILRSASKAGSTAQDGSPARQRELAAEWFAEDKFSYRYGVLAKEIDDNARDLAAGLASPISGKIIAPYMKNFSPGDAYCLRITDRNKLAKLYARDSFLQKYYYPTSFNDRQYMYYRIYGEKGVIAEGICLVKPPKEY